MTNTPALTSHMPDGEAGPPQTESETERDAVKDRDASLAPMPVSGLYRKAPVNTDAIAQPDASAA